MDLWDIVEKETQARLGNYTRIVSLLEYGIDLVSQTCLDLSRMVDQTKITPEIQGRLDALQLLLQYSSIDFDNINDPYNFWKIGLSAQSKQISREIQDLYLKNVIK